MREVIVTVGTRASGKSTFCKKVLDFDPSIVGISRDEILLKLFGTTCLNSYSGGHQHAQEKMWELVEHALAPQDVRIILDVWNGDRRDRRYILRKLRELGAEYVVAWYFTTPVNVVEEWFWNKPGIAKISGTQNHQGKGLTFYTEDAPRRDHELFHELASGIDTDGFDEVIRINPVIAGPEHVLCLQTSLDF